jgi:hypothetical protein
VARVIRKQKGSSGYPVVSYRDAKGTLRDALVVSAATLGTPTAPTVAPQGTAGATSYSYKITAMSDGGETVGSTAGTTATGNATLSAGNFNRVTWAAVTGATAYRIYGRIGASEGLLGIVFAGATLQFDDIGAVTPGVVPPVSGTGLTYTIRVGSLIETSGYVKATIGARSNKAQSNVIL